jgi:hypothetical protein
MYSQCKTIGVHSFNGLLTAYNLVDTIDFGIVLIVKSDDIEHLLPVT